LKGDIYLVEDDLDVLDYYRFLLAVEGFSVWAADTNGEAAITRFRATANRPDAVILDHRLPGCNGDVVARKMLELDPDVCILYITADDTGIQQAKELGIRRLKRKPCDNERLIRNLAEGIEDRRRRLARRG
jgi:CheY-like chemotaxis protein